MKKTISIAAMVLASLPMMAGGLLTNTNQNAAFLRNMAQDGQVTLTSLYANPAGNVFLSEGWHMSLNSQTAIQQRNISTTFPYFAAKLALRDTTKHTNYKSKHSVKKHTASPTKCLTLNAMDQKIVNQIHLRSHFFASTFPYVQKSRFAIIS